MRENKRSLKIYDENDSFNYTKVVETVNDIGILGLFGLFIYVMYSLITLH